MRWDDLPHVVSPVGRTLDDILAPGPQRQHLPGYDPSYRDFVDYILRCTHRIWEEKNVGLCRTHYSKDCVIHTLAGPVHGVDAVIAGTLATLTATPDRRLIGEDVIWSDDGDGSLYSSHRINSTATHLGDDALLGQATLRPAGVMTIADCRCTANRIVEEWLARDNLRGVLQIGGNPWAIATAQAAADAVGDPARHRWRTDAMDRTRTTGHADIPDGHPAAAVVAMMSAAFNDGLHGDAAAALSPAVEVRWPTGRHGFGRGCWIGCMMQMQTCLPGAVWRADHVAARPLPLGDTAVALRWSLAGTHLGSGLWAEASGREIYIMGISHYRLRGGAIVEDMTVFDELAVLRQISGGLGA